MIRVVPFNLTTLVKAAILAALPLSAFAGTYDGPALDPTFSDVKPGKSSGCDQYVNTSPRLFAACQFGRDEAERFANHFSGGNGRIQGYLHGFAWGLYKATQSGKDDANQINIGSKSVENLSQYMDPAVQEAKDAAASLGITKGNSDAVERFVSVLDKDQNPDATLHVPETNYAGEDSGYDRLVGPVAPSRTIIQKEIDPDLSHLKVYDTWDETFLGEKKPVNGWELVTDNGDYPLNKPQWFDPNNAFLAWTTSAVDTHSKYDSLNNPPFLDQAGKTIDLQAIFQNAFQESYQKNVNYFFSVAFQSSLGDGEAQGQILGTELGKRLAQYKGLVQGFNSALKTEEALNYRTTFTSIYSAKFNTTFADYLNNPKLTIVFKGIQGVEDVGVIEPNARISALFDIRNMGGTPSDLTVSVSGDVQEASPQTFKIGKLCTRSFIAPRIAKIDSHLLPHDRARITLAVNGVTTEIDQMVERLLAVSSSGARLDVSNGSGEFHVNLKNISRIRTPGLVSVELRINDKLMDTEQAGLLDLDENRDIVLPFSKLDPLDLVAGTLKAKLTVLMDRKLLNESVLPIQIDYRLDALASYFNALADDRGFVPEGVLRPDRIQALIAGFVFENQKQVGSHCRIVERNVWRLDTASTIAGLLNLKYHSQTQSDHGKAVYDQLARALWPARKDFYRFLFFKSRKEITYERLVMEMSLTGELE